MPKTKKVLEVAGREVTITSPDKPYFPELGLTKLDVVRHYQAVGPGALRGVAHRPLLLKRFVKGITHKPFFQKQAPKNLPEWMDTVTLSYRSGHSVQEVVVRDLAGLLWTVNLGCIDLNPHPVRDDDVHHPDQLRVDLDPVPGVDWATVRDVALLARDVLADSGLDAFPKTSGSRGMHLLVPIERRWPFAEVRRAAQALARRVAQLAPGRATARWRKEEREGVLLDYNQNAFDRTTCSAWSVRPLPDARVSMPLFWDEVPDCDPAAHTIHTAAARFAELGDPHAALDDAAPGSLDGLLALADEQDAHPEARPPPKPLIVVAQSPDHDAAMAGLDRWKARWPDVVEHLAPHHVLVDKQRGRSSTWTRIRINLERVPHDARPPQETPDPDDDPTRAWRRS